MNVFNCGPLAGQTRAVLFAALHQQRRSFMSSLSRSWNLFINFSWTFLRVPLQRSGFKSQNYTWRARAEQREAEFCQPYKRVVAAASHATCLVSALRRGLWRQLSARGCYLCLSYDGFPSLTPVKMVNLERKKCLSLIRRRWHQNLTFTVDVLYSLRYFCCQASL